MNRSGRTGFFTQGWDFVINVAKTGYSGMKKRCPECRAEAAENAERRGRTDQDREKDNACHKILYRERREQGICVRCGKCRAVQGKARCITCLMKEREQDRRRYVPAEIPRGERNRYGLCITCSNSLDMDGMKVCSRCYADLKKAREAVREDSPWKEDNRVVFQKRTGVSPDVTTEKAKIIFHTAPYADAFLGKT